MMDDIDQYDAIAGTMNHVVIADLMDDTALTIHRYGWIVNDILISIEWEVIAIICKGNYGK